jgi:thymidylate synthase (FAD)
MLLLYGAYEEMVATGIANESARAVLPMCTPTMLYMSGSIRSFLHYCQVRMTPDTQKEHREIAEGIAHILSTEVPIVWNAFQRYCIDKE